MQTAPPLLPRSCQLTCIISLPLTASILLGLGALAGRAAAPPLLSPSNCFTRAQGRPAGSHRVGIQQQWGGGEQGGSAGGGDGRGNLGLCGGHHCLHRAREVRVWPFLLSLGEAFWGEDWEVGWVPNSERGIQDVQVTRGPSSAAARSTGVASRPAAAGAGVAGRQRERWLPWEPGRLFQGLRAMHVEHACGGQNRGRGMDVMQCCPSK
jgi:hypothetical protein